MTSNSNPPLSTIHPATDHFVALASLTGLDVDFSEPLGLATPPIIVRLAGLPARALEPLASSSCVALLQARESLTEELGEVRRSIVKAISDALLRFDISTRRFLLAIKRNCFNGRTIETYRRKAEWFEFHRISPDLADRIVFLEDQLREIDCAFTALYESELIRERRHILDLIQDRRFLRGVALGRSGLVQKLQIRAPSIVASGPLKAITKWEQSFLRFVTRAAAKLSANSTLTTYALGGVQESTYPLGLHFVDSPQREVSLVRINRPELEQFQALLMRNAAVRERALVSLNDSLEELGQSRYRFLRSGYWDLTPGTEEFNFVRPARITVTLSNELLGAAQDALRDGALRYDVLLSILEEGHGISTSKVLNRRALDQLVDLGILILTPPWPTYEARLEQRIGQFLKTLPDEPELRATVDAMDQLLFLEESFISAPNPESCVASMEDTFSRLIGTVAHLAGSEVCFTPAKPANFFEDVFFESTSNDDRVSLRIASPTIQEILRSAGLVLRFAGLFNHRHDVLHTLAAWWRDHEPSRREIPFTEVAQGFSPLWRQFHHFHKTANESTLNTFDPLHTSALATLREKRETLLSQYKKLLSSSPTNDVLPVQQFEELLATLPRRYAPLLGPCVFVQPADAEGDSWVLNHLHEGTGRYLSRITPVLEESLRKRFLSHLIARSTVALDEEEADLLEVMNPWGNLVNAHPPQAAKVLDSRDVHLDLPQEQRVSLGDLTVQAALDSETFRLIDSSGRRVLPVNLSSLADIWQPNLLRFLLAFGPGETRGVFPSAHSEGDDSFSVFSRLTCGKLVLRRQRWKIGINNLRDELEKLTDQQSYTYIHAWRQRLSLPSVVFFYERTYQGAFKPQYLNFDSPLLCSIFVSSLRKRPGGHLILEEALPSPADFPLDVAMNRRGLELLIDSLAIRTTSGIPPLG